MSKSTFEHMSAMHRAASQSFAGEAGMHRDAEKCHTAMAESCEKIGDGHAMRPIMDAMKTFHLGMAKAHGAAADRCEKSADWHSQCGEECLKAEVSRLQKANAVRPDGMSGIPLSDSPENAFSSFGRVVAVPRHGAPELNKTLESVPHEFRHLVELSEDL
jgi:hypothetical protein